MSKGADQVAFAQRLGRRTAAQPVARIDPMQDPMRPGYAMNYAENETPAETVLRKLACWLGVGGYNAPTVDAELFHRKIVDGVQSLLRDAPPAQPLTPEKILDCVRATGMVPPMGLTRDVGPYNITEPTYYLTRLVAAVEREHGIVPKGRPPSPDRRNNHG